MTSRMPAIFFGHGNPMNALQTNAYTDAWSAMATRMPLPRAIVSVSAHWFMPGTHVTAMSRPRTIHDFGGFPQELYAVQYPAPGAPGLAAEIQKLLAPVRVTADEDWGLDHGTWSVLKHLYPAADIPVIQLSIDETQPAEFHYAVGRRLRALRDDGILLIGSGDIVHNLRTYAWDRGPMEPYDWAVRFESRVRELILRRDHGPLIEYGSLGRDAALAAPTPEHYLPLLYVLGAAGEDDEITFPVEGVDGGSVSMLALQVG
jgi:4,5-DOPA dioxygenase extradiol